MQQIDEIKRMSELARQLREHGLARDNTDALHQARSATSSDPAVRQECREEELQSRFALLERKFESSLRRIDDLESQLSIAQKKTSELASQVSGLSARLRNVQDVQASSVIANLTAKMAATSQGVAAQAPSSSQQDSSVHSSSTQSASAPSSSASQSFAPPSSVASLSSASMSSRVPSFASSQSGFGEGGERFDAVSAAVGSEPVAAAASVDGSAPDATSSLTPEDSASAIATKPISVSTLVDSPTAAASSHSAARAPAQSASSSSSSQNSSSSSLSSSSSSQSSSSSSPSAHSEISIEKFFYCGNRK